MILAHQPNVTVKVTGEQIVGQSVVVECKIEAAIDIDSTVDIICTTGNNVEMRRLTNVPDHSLNNYSVFFSTPLLSRNDDNRRYQCEVITNTSPQVKATGSVTLNVTCKYISLINNMQINLHTFMHVYIKTELIITL